MKTHCKHTGYPLEESLEHISQACIFGRRSVGRHNRRRRGQAGSGRGGRRGRGGGYRESGVGWGGIGGRHKVNFRR